MKFPAIRLLPTLLCLSLFLSISPLSPTPIFATPLSTPSNVPTLGYYKLDLTLKTAMNLPKSELISSVLNHNTPLIDPYLFTPSESDFATNRWQKYITCIYTYATDTDFIVSTAFADGRIEQKHLPQIEAVTAYIDTMQTSNETIQKLAHATPDNTFKSFYSSVYKSNLIQLYDIDLIDLNLLNTLDLKNKAPELENAITQHLSIYKKGSFYLLVCTNYPNAMQTSFVSSSLQQIDKMVLNIQTKQFNALSMAKLINPVSLPADNKDAKLIYVFCVYKDQTYTLTTFKNQADADQFIQSQTKLLGKTSVKVSNSQADIAIWSKGLKQRTSSLK